MDRHVQDSCGLHPPGRAEAVTVVHQPAPRDRHCFESSVRMLRKAWHHLPVVHAPPIFASKVRAHVPAPQRAPVRGPQRRRVAGREAVVVVDGKKERVFRGPWPALRKPRHSTNSPSTSHRESNNNTGRRIEVNCRCVSGAPLLLSGPPCRLEEIRRYFSIRSEDTVKLMMTTEKEKTHRWTTLHERTKKWLDDDCILSIQFNAGRRNKVSVRVKGPPEYYNNDVAQHGCRRIRQ